VKPRGRLPLAFMAPPPSVRGDENDPSSDFRKIQVTTLSRQRLVRVDRDCRIHRGSSLLENGDPSSE
jgi:hypothetical protein